MSRDMGFNMTDQALSPEAFRSAIKDVVVPFIQRKRQAMLDQMSIYGKPGMNPAATSNGTSSGMVTFRDSTGKSWTIPSDKLNAARQRDPGLQVIQ